MRIAVATRHRDHVGGVETYLERLLPTLDAHAVMLWHEFDGADRPIALPAGTPCVSVQSRGPAAALAALASWKPDVVFAHGLSSPALEAALQDLAPSALLLHTYHGTCVGGTKTHAFPRIVPCTRHFGVGCLVRYFPRRCGGLSPVTMVARYRTEAAHGARLGGYRAIATLSGHMREEAIRHGAVPDDVRVLPPPFEHQADASLSPARLARLVAFSDPGQPVRLLFLGRLEPAKGGPVLLEAAPLVAARLGRPVDVVFAGDGRRRAAWERLAASVGAPVTTSFVGHADAGQRARWFDWADLLVVPSLWPEPFGLVGGEAASAGVPAVAFDVGGTSEWLDDGRTGRLAGAGLDATSFADAVAWALEDGRLRSLSEAARARAATWSMPAHRDAVIEVLQRAAGDPARG
jgi:glycosyltransferase involved in cell wall biosynthesis